MLYRLSYFRVLRMKWVLMDSNHRSRKTADLQSAPFGHSGKHPCFNSPVSLVACFESLIKSRFEPYKDWLAPILLALFEPGNDWLAPILLALFEPGNDWLAPILLALFEPLVGFEPTTPRLQITCSGQLS